MLLTEKKCLPNSLCSHKLNHKYSTLLQVKLFLRQRQEGGADEIRNSTFKYDSGESVESRKYEIQMCDCEKGLFCTHNFPNKIVLVPSSSPLKSINITYGTLTLYAYIPHTSRHHQILKMARYPDLCILYGKRALAVFDIFSQINTTERPNREKTRIYFYVVRNFLYVFRIYYVKRSVCLGKTKNH